MAKEFISDQTRVEIAVTSPENWAKFMNTGDNHLLNDVDIRTAPKGTHAIIATEGTEREIILE